MRRPVFLPNWKPYLFCIYNNNNHHREITENVTVDYISVRTRGGDKISTMRNRTSSLVVLVCIILCYYSSLLFAAAQNTYPAEVNALIKIKGRLGDPYGKLKNWGKGDPCKVPWTGVLCYSAPAADGYFRLERLQLLNMNLTGNLAPEIGLLQDLKILDFMWNNISGNIPKEIGYLATLELLLLNGNQLSGALPEELGYLTKLNRIQIDLNNISGSIPKSFANLIEAKHFHMNNNSLSGQIPKELSKLPNLIHLLLDNNNLTGELPSELANMPNLEILQLDNNHFTNSMIPHSYVNMTELLKLSLRNCSLQGSIPDFSTIPALSYLDLSYNGLTGNISSHKLSSNITTINLSHNKLEGPIPSSFADLPLLQKLLLDSNQLSGSVPSIGLNISFDSVEKLLLDFQNNNLSNIADMTRLENQHPNIILWLNGNPVCRQVNIYHISKLCSTMNGSEDTSETSNKSNSACNPCSSPYYEYIPNSSCFCATPIEVGYRLKSPGFSFFPPYIKMFEKYLTSELNLHLYQLSIASYSWSPGPRLDMNLKIFPPQDLSARELNQSEIQRIRNVFTGWEFNKSDILGPYEWINFTPHNDLGSGESGLSKGALAGILIGTIVGTVVVTSIIVTMILKRQAKYSEVASKRKFLAKKRVKVAGVKDFEFKEMALATNNFSVSMQIGQGGYGRVYKGLLNDGTEVAIKRAREGSLQGENEFSTEIELLSRLHHRNLVSLVGYCDDQGEQMLVYEYIGNGSLRDHLSGNLRFKPLDFALRLRIALGSARGILYLHNEANPPVFHRDIKASNILLDDKFNARVADFGLSKLASLPDIEGSAPDPVSTVVKGTPGYLDPEYFLTHQLTDKSDVYSFGVVLLELLTGMEPISNGKNIVREVNMAYQSGTMLSMIDKRMSSYLSECLEPFASLALRCCKDETDARPAIAEVVQVLENIFQLMPAGADHSSTPSIQSRMDPMDIEKSAIDVFAQNPCISSNIAGSDLLSGNIHEVAPR